MASSSSNHNNAANGVVEDHQNDYDDDDETPTFIDMNSAVEVHFPDDDNNDDDNDDDDDDAMMDDDDDDVHESLEAATAPPIVDMSKATFSSHTDAVYAIASHFDRTSHTLSIVSGGGDDRAYLHHVHIALNATPTTAPLPAATTTTTIPLTHPHTDSISCVSFNTPYITHDTSGKLQQNLIGVGSYDGSIILYNAMDGTLVCPFDGPTDVEFITFHPRGGTVLLAGSISDGTIWMYHISSKSCLQVFVGHTGGVTSGAFTPDGKWVVSVGQDGTCRVWAPKTGTSKHVFRLMEENNNGSGGGGGGGGGLTCLAVGGGPDGQLAICGGEDGNAYVVHISGKKLVAKLPHFEESSSSNNNNNTHTSKGNAKDATMDDDNDEEDDDDGMEEEEGEARSIEAVGFCPANIAGTAHWCATGGVDGILKIWNASVGGGSGAQLRQRCVRTTYNNDTSETATGAGGTAGITKLAWHSTLPLVICSYTDGVIGIWDARLGKLITSLTGHEDMINDMSVSFTDAVLENNSNDDGTLSSVMMVVTGSDDKMVKLFEFHP